MLTRRFLTCGCIRDCLINTVMFSKVFEGSEAMAIEQSLETGRNGLHR